MKEKINLTKNEKLIKMLIGVKDKTFYRIIKKFNVKIGKPPYISDEKLLGAIALVTDVPFKDLIKEIDHIKKVKK
jgi:hypothetical protein